MSIHSKALAAFAVLAGGSIISLAHCVYTRDWAVQIPNFTPNAGLPHWRKCRAKVIANAGNCTVLIIGESTPRGWGATWGGNDAASTAWPVQVALGLRLDCDNKRVTCINAQSNSFAGSGSVGSPAAFAAYDTRLSMGTWSLSGWNTPSCYNSASLVVGGCSMVSTDTTSTFTFNPKNTTSYPSASAVPTDTVDVYSMNMNQSEGFGTLLVNVNGGSTLASIAQGGAGALTYTKTTVTTGVAAADNTWGWRCSVTNYCLFDTVVLRNSAVSEASFINMGMGGATVENWNLSGNAYNPLTAIQNVFHPDLCIIQDQGNDQDAGTVIATYKTNLTAIITTCQASGDAMIVTSQQGQPGLACGACAGGIIPYYDTQQTYVTAQHQVATATNVPILDWWTTLCGAVSGSGAGSTCSKGGWSAGMANGWNGGYNGATADPIHQGPPAYAILASQVAAILRM